MIKDLLLLLLIFLIIDIKCSNEYIRAAWIAHIQCPDEIKCKELIQSLASYKINRIYVCAWNNGKTYFESQTMRNSLGEIGIGQDILSWTIKYSQEYGIPEVFAWFEYGLMASYETLETPFAKFAYKNNWIKGKYLNFWYMNPETQALDFLANIMRDAALNYKLTGLQLDDHFDCPSAFLGCNVKIMHNSAQLINKIIREKSQIKLSISPMPLPNSINLSNVDWPKMLESKFFTDVAPQYYTTTFSVFKAKIEENEKYLTQEMKEMLILGVRVNGSGPLTEWTEIEKMLNFAKEKKYGICIWYSKGIVFDYPNEFKNYWKITNN